MMIEYTEVDTALLCQAEGHWIRKMPCKLYTIGFIEHYEDGYYFYQGEDSPDLSGGILKELYQKIHELNEALT